MASKTHITNFEELEPSEHYTLFDKRKTFKQHNDTVSIKFLGVSDGNFILKYKPPDSPESIVVSVSQVDFLTNDIIFYR